MPMKTYPGFISFPEFFAAFRAGFLSYPIKVIAHICICSFRLEFDKGDVVGKVV